MTHSPVAVGLAASSFFSATFIVNRAIGLAGGHWYWTASMRYVWVIGLLTGWFLVRRQLRDVVGAFRAHWLFWTIAGSIGVGVFYAALTYATTRAPGWVVACTMQFSILAAPMILVLFGRLVQRRSVLLLALIFTGIVLVNLERRDASTGAQIVSALPALLAAFAFPIGSQLVQEGQTGGQAPIPAVEEPITADATARVLLLTLGSVPFWLLLLMLPHPPLPTRQQLLGTFIVAVCGTIGHALFLYARQMGGTDANAIAKVEATQSSYTAVTLAGEVAFLNAPPPGLLGFAGLAMVVGGLAAHSARKS